MTASVRPPSRLAAFLHSEAAGGVLLMGAAALAMLVANSPLSGAYFGALAAHIGPLSVLHWINDALMALFFMLVGLEIKREFIGGSLSSWPARILPGVAALSGMAAPALVYLLVTGGAADLARGWAIPSATDIAFAIGVMALLGSRAPVSLKVFLTTVAIVDDMGAVVVIAVAYTSSIDFAALAAAAGVLAAMFALNRARVTALWPYLILAAGLWLAVFLSGVHATVAGVLAASMIPARSLDGRHAPPLERLAGALHPWVTFAVVPVFGFANAGLSFAGIELAHVLAPLPLGVAAGLVIGKQAGIFLAVATCVRLGLAPRPAGATWTQIYGVALLCGIGFTMSLFIGGLAFADPMLMDEVKIGVLGGSLVSATAGFALLRFARPSQPREAAAERMSA